MLGKLEPGDHERWAVEKLSPPGTFGRKLDTEICNCGEKRLAFQSGEPATEWFIRPGRSRRSAI